MAGGEMAAVGLKLSRRDHGQTTVENFLVVVRIAPPCPFTNPLRGGPREELAVTNLAV